MDGTKTKQEIETQVINQHGVTVRLDVVIDMLSEQGLFEDINVENFSKIEMDLYSDPVIRINLEKVYSTIRKQDGIMMLCLMITFSVIAIAVGLFVWNELINKQQFMLGEINWRQICPWQVVFVFLVSLISIVAHELGHLMMAAHYGVRTKSMNIILKFGVMPAFYVRYEGFYEAPIKKRIKVLFGGIYMNLFLLSLFGIFYFFTNSWFCMILCLLNLYDIIGNISPLSNTDGYYIFSFILGFEGFRWKIIRKVSSLLKGSAKWKDLFEADNIKYILYFFVSVCVMVVSLEKLLVKAFLFFSIEIKGVWVTSVIIICIVVRVLLSFKTSVSKLKKIT